MTAPNCTTCQGPIRETVNMVCQDCGRDYGARPAIVDPDRPTVDEIQASGERLGLPQWVITAGIDAARRREVFDRAIEENRATLKDEIQREFRWGDPEAAIKFANVPPTVISVDQPHDDERE